MAKNIGGFLEKLIDYFLNIIANVNFFGHLKSKHYPEVMLQVSLK